MTWRLHFLGTGAAGVRELGSAAAVIERDGAPCLLIDCGPDTVASYLDAYAEPPRAVYVTHTHLDHVGGFERLFGSLKFSAPGSPPAQIFAHAALVPLLQARVADYPNVLAEGGVNFWDVFRLTPCSRGFWLDGFWFEVFATRHHAPGTSFGLALPGSLVYTGDTRPIAETLVVHGARGELVAHDCGLLGNPSHTGADDLLREYSEALRGRLTLYHYGSIADGEALAAQGYAVAKPGQRLDLPPAWPPGDTAG